MIKAIPYFGDKNNEIINSMFSMEIKEEINTDIYSYINSHVDNCNTLVVLIDNKYLTYLSDIQFNYRDKKIVLPYWEYDLYKITKEDNIAVKKDKFQYLVRDNEGNFYVRYNYRYRELQVKVGTSIDVFDINTETKQRINFNALTTMKEFDIDELYTLYVESSYTDMDNLFYDRVKGYYFIDKFYSGMYNRELNLRHELFIETFSDEYSYEQLKDYRDVRNYTQEQITKQYGLLQSTENYRERRLRFDSLLYCVLHSNMKCTDKEFEAELAMLGKSKNIVKYGDSIKLIFKSYWLDNYKPIRYKTYYKVKKESLNLKQKRK